MLKHAEHLVQMYNPDICNTLHYKAKYTTSTNMLLALLYHNLNIINVL